MSAAMILQSGSGQPAHGFSSKTVPPLALPSAFVVP
jgi:hypothetical protein